jgi:hypothetical protein
MVLSMWYVASESKGEAEVRGQRRRQLTRGIASTMSIRGKTWEGEE